MALQPRQMEQGGKTTRYAMNKAYTFDASRPMERRVSTRKAFIDSRSQTPAPCDASYFTHWSTRSSSRNVFLVSAHGEDAPVSTTRAPLFAVPASSPCYLPATLDRRSASVLQVIHSDLTATTTLVLGIKPKPCRSCRHLHRTRYLTLRR